MTISLVENDTHRDWTAWAHGMAGMLIFSASLPATRLAVEALDPWFVTAGRALIAGLLASAALLVLRAPLPTRRDWRDLVLTALGVVVGFRCSPRWRCASCHPATLCPSLDCCRWRPRDLRR